MYPHFPQLLVKGAVFSRMSPNQKAQLVSDLQKLGWVSIEHECEVRVHFTVVMVCGVCAFHCGDGMCALW